MRVHELYHRSRAESGFTIYWTKVPFDSICEGTSWPNTTGANGCYRVLLDDWSWECKKDSYDVWAIKNTVYTDTVRIAWNDHDVMLCVPE